MQIETNFTKMEPANQRETAAQDFLRPRTSTGWDPVGEGWLEGSQGPVPPGSWDLPCHLPPWRPAGPEGEKEQHWALCCSGRGLKPSSSASRLFSQIPLGYSCCQPASSYPLEGGSAPRAPVPSAHTPQSHVILLSSRVLIRKAWGGPKWRQDVDPSGNLSRPWANRPQILRAHEEGMTGTGWGPCGQGSHVP